MQSAFGRTLRRVDAGARNNHRAKVGHQVGKMPIAGCPGNFHVELEIWRYCVGVLFNGGLERLQRCAHGVQIGAAAPLRRKPGCLGFQADAQFQDSDHVGDGRQILGRDLEVAAQVASADKGTNAVARFHQPRGLQPGQGLAHHGAADVEARHDFGLGRQFVAGRDGPAADALAQAFDNLHHQAAGPPNTGKFGRHRARALHSRGFSC